MFGIHASDFGAPGGHIVTVLTIAPSTSATQTLATPCLLARSRSSVFRASVTTTSGNISLISTTGTLTIGNTGSQITTTSGNTTLTAGNDILLQHSIAGGSGMVAISANTDGLGSEGFVQSSNRTITTTNTSLNSVSIAVNTAGGGTGNATIAGITAGGAAGGTLTINSAFTIDRTEWGMNYGKGKIDDKVSLVVAVSAKK